MSPGNVAGSLKEQLGFLGLKNGGPSIVRHKPTISLATTQSDKFNQIAEEVVAGDVQSIITIGSL